MKPDSYWFITSQDLTVGQKDQLLKALSPWVLNTGHILGSRDIDGLLTTYPAVEQAHPKLWLSTGTQLFWATHADIANRSAALKDRIEEVLPRYVINDSFNRAVAMLEAHKVCLVAGLPGIGKTTLAYTLVADAMSRGYEPVEVSEDIKEAWSALRSKVPQVFLYDDFLGQLTFSERLGKNEDARLADFIHKVSSAKSKLLVMATREYILRDAERVYARLSKIDKNQHLVLELNDYTREDRARILYNHLWHSDIASGSLAEIADSGWRQIVDHPNYSPRLVEYCTGPSFDVDQPGYALRFIDNLEHPERLWRTAFEDHLTELQQLVAVALATLPPVSDLDDLKAAHESLCGRRGLHTSAALFRAAMQVLEGGFISSEMAYGTSQVQFHNPSIRAFVLDWIASDRNLVRDVLTSAAFFEQVSNIYLFATGHRAVGRSPEPSAVKLKEAVGAMSGDVSTALIRLVASATPERGGKYVSDRVTPVTGWLERRLLFMAALPDDVRPSKPWMSEQVTRAGTRWRQQLGAKAKAVELMQVLEANSPVLVDSHDLAQAGEALDEWLSRDLDETAEDWLPYLDRLKRVHQFTLSDRKDIATAFEEHALDELHRWSPSPPDLDELIHYAREFELHELQESLEEAARAEDEQESEPEPPRTQAQRPTSGILATDADLASMFKRLA